MRPFCWLCVPQCPFHGIIWAHCSTLMRLWPLLAWRSYSSTNTYFFLVSMAMAPISQMEETRVYNLIPNDKNCWFDALKFSACFAYSISNIINKSKTITYKSTNRPQICTFDMTSVSELHAWLWKATTTASNDPSDSRQPKKGGRRQFYDVVASLRHNCGVVWVFGRFRVSQCRHTNLTTSSD